MQFLDAHNFDVRSVKKTCVHIVHPDGRIIPFDTYNLFYRDGREAMLSRAAGRGPVAGDGAAELAAGAAGRAGAVRVVRHVRAG